VEGDAAVFTQVTKYDKDNVNTYHYIPFKPLEKQQSIFWALNNWIKQQTYTVTVKGTTENRQLNGIYRTTGPQEKPFGYLIDSA
jgi:hypothetical protein